MYAKLLCVLILAYQIITNESASDENDIDYSDSVEITTEARPISTRPDGYFEFPDVQAVYKVYEDVETTWYEARDRCAAEGAILGIPDSVEKIKHIKSLQLKVNKIKWLHTGIWKSNVTNEWVRIDNHRPVSNFPWAAYAPGNLGNCTGISIASDKILNYQCERDGEHYVCEKPIEAY